MKHLVEKFTQSDRRLARGAREEEDDSDMGILLADMALDIEEMSRDAAERKKYVIAGQERLEEEKDAIRRVALRRVKARMEGGEAAGGQQELVNWKKRSGSEGGRKKRK